MKEPTIKAVLVYAKELRERDLRARVRDPYARKYAPSDDTARKLCSEVGPARALEELATKALMQDRKNAEESARATRAELDHKDRQVKLRREREQMLAAMTAGQRLDRVLRALELLSETSAQRLDGDRVTGSKERGAVFVGRRQLERERLLEDARDLVRRGERLLESSRRRMLEEAA